METSFIFVTKATCEDGQLLILSPEMGWRQPFPLFQTAYLSGPIIEISGTDENLLGLRSDTALPQSPDVYLASIPDDVTSGETQLLSISIKRGYDTMISKNAACEGRPSPHNPYGGSRPFCSYRQPRPSYRCLLSYTGAKEERASNCCCSVSVATQTRSSTSRSSRPGLTLASACIKPNALDAAIRPRGQTSETTSTAQKYYLSYSGQRKIGLQGLQFFLLRIFICISVFHRIWSSHCRFLVFYRIWLYLMPFLLA